MTPGQWGAMAIVGSGADWYERKRCLTNRASQVEIHTPSKLAWEQQLVVIDHVDHDAF